MGDDKIEGDEGQKQLAEIKETVKRIEGKVIEIENKGKTQLFIQIFLGLLVFVCSTVLVVVSVGLTTGAGERIYGHWVGLIFGFLAAAMILYIGFFSWKFLTIDKNTGSKTK